jgi:hypothetical protein
MTSENDRSIVRDLASEYKALCDSQHNRETIEHWRSVNNLESTRPMVYANFGLLGPEIAPQLPESKVEDPVLRNAERRFQRSLWEATLEDDRTFNPWYGVATKMFRHPEGTWGVEPNRIKDESSRGWRNMPVLKTMADLDRLKATEHRVLDPYPENARQLEDAFGDILPVRVKKSTIYPVWGGTDLSEAAGALFGLEELMYLIYENPEMLHRFMAFTRDAVIANLKQGEAAGDWGTADSWYYITPSHCDALPDPDLETGAKLKDIAWFSHAQEFEGVSPAQHKEFLLDYQMPILELFGKIAYGCCGTLDTKLDILKEIPNLGKILSGPRSDPAHYPDTFGDRCMISWRPIASIVAGENFNEDLQRKQLREGLTKLKGCHMEVHMHEPMTVQGDLSRIRTWIRIAREEANA